jgi:putative ubiquitin-RnfH superfamily antitoxin RatB of RatAB toxin-antitoxin module
MSSAEWSSPIGGIAALLRKHRAAQQAGLKAAAYIVYNEVKRGLRGGYTTGDFVTGNVLNSVTISAIVEESGVFGIRVGSNVPYALYWELGHHNAWTRKFERVEVWRPALVDTRDEQAAAYARAYKRSMLGQGGAE